MYVVKKSCREELSVTRYLEARTHHVPWPNSLRRHMAELNYHTVDYHFTELSNLHLLLR